MKTTTLKSHVAGWIACSLLVVIASCASNPVSISGSTARLSDEPSAQFDISDWSYTNISSPFVLTPDLITNALIGVSRLEKSEKTPGSEVLVPEELNLASIEKMIQDRFESAPEKEISIESYGDRRVVVGRRSEKDREIAEYAFVFGDHLAHVALSALPGAYYERGVRVAEELVASFAPTQ